MPDHLQTSRWLVLLKAPNVHAGGETLVMEGTGSRSGTVVTLTSLSHAFFGSYYSYIICCLLASKCTTKWRHHFYFSQACVYLFSGLSVHLWHPTYRNMDCIKSWLLKADLSSPENQLARYIISNLSWGQMGEVCRNRVLFCTA